MAQFRYVYTEFWEDPKVSETFTPEDKLFFLYLLTNPNTTQVGVYRITKKVIAFELGYSIESVNALMDRFIEHHKLIEYNSETREIAIKNWGKFNLKNNGKPIQDCITKELKTIEDKDLVAYVCDGIKNVNLKNFILNAIGMPVNDGEEGEEGSDDSYGASTPRPRIVDKTKTKTKTKTKSFSNIYSQNENDSVDNMDNLEKSDGTSEEVEDASDITYQEVVDMYNSICVSMPQVKKLSIKRKKGIKTFLKEFENNENVKEIFIKAESSDFLSGRNGTWQACNFDWIINSNNALKVLEGTYDNKTTHVNNSKESTFNAFKCRPDALEKYREVQRSHMNNRIEDDNRTDECSSDERVDSKSFMERIKQRAKRNQ